MLQYKKFLHIVKVWLLNKFNTLYAIKFFFILLLYYTCHMFLSDLLV